MICAKCKKDKPVLVPRHRKDIKFGLVCSDCDKRYEQKKMDFEASIKKIAREIVVRLEKTNNNLDYEILDIESIIRKLLQGQHE